MAQFFELFPRVQYNIYGETPTRYNYPVNIMVRFGFIKTALDGIFNYFEYTIRENETPEMLAERYYGNPEYHWVIMLVNNVVDPQYDWPLSYREFQKYIISKYGSIEAAQNINSIHHYVKKQRTVDMKTTKETIITTNISQSEYLALPLEEGPPVIRTFPNGNQIELYPEYAQFVTYYDHEVALNESRREIKIIKSDYIQQIQTEFENIMKAAGGMQLQGYNRRLV